MQTLTYLTAAANCGLLPSRNSSDQEGPFATKVKVFLCGTLAEEYTQHAIEKLGDEKLHTPKSVICSILVLPVLACC